MKRFILTKELFRKWST